MSGGQRLPLSVVGPVALKLRDMLAPTCEQIEFAGSLRRADAGDPAIGDVEIVAIPKPLILRFGVPASQQVTPLENMLLEMIDRGMIRRWPVDIARAAWGQKYKKFWIPVAGQWFQVDLFLPDRDNFGAIFTIRTGSSTFSKALVTHIKYKTPYVQEDGYLKRKADGVIVPVPDEGEYFRRAGVTWIPAVKRTGPAALEVIKTAGSETESDPSLRRGPDRQLSMF